jgi:hypothetical protein
MRTTLTLDDDVASALKREADRSGRSFKEVVNEAVRAGLQARLVAPGAQRYRLRPARLGAVREGLAIDKALGLAAMLEDEEMLREFELGK